MLFLIFFEKIGYEVWDFLYYLLIFFLKTKFIVFNKQKFNFEDYQYFQNYAAPGKNPGTNIIYF